jgi:DinB superfamily
MPRVIGPPGTDEYADFHKGYIAAVANEPDGIAVLEGQQSSITQFARLSPQQASHRYADGKWSVKEVIGHLCDAERVVSYRLLRIARGDKTPLPGFDEAAIAAASNADRRELADLVAELSVVRQSTLALVKSLDETGLSQRGTVNDWSLTAHGIVFIIAGHFAHHMNVLRERYGITV